MVTVYIGFSECEVSLELFLPNINCLDHPLESSSKDINVALW
jgi:hypothetical protein